MGVGASLGDDGRAVAVTDQDPRALLAIKDTFGRSDILLQRGQNWERSATMPARI
jgi:hypothetical protein